MFYFDPLYMMLMLIGLPLVFIPQWWVKRTFDKYAQVRTGSGRTGADVAREILNMQGIGNVAVEVTHGILSDHYDPIHKKVRLSEDNYYGTSVSAVAVAAHEVGHAIQHARGFFPVVIRSAMVPAVNLGSQFGPLLIFISILLMSMRVLAPDLGLLIAWGGVILFGLAVAFHFVTLPVEIDASRRAIGVLQTTRYLTTQEIPLAKKVLTAAAMTYVATALYSLMQLMYYILQLLGSRQRD
jgi:Zn-dependent membrane protease YugP